MAILVIFFLILMVITAGTYLMVNRTLLNRDTAKVRERLTGTAQEGTNSPQATPLFLPEKAEQQRWMRQILQKFNLDSRLQTTIEQAGLAWAPGQVCLVCLLLALAAFNAVWYLTPFGTFAGLPAAAAAGALPIAYILRTRRKRIEAFEAQFPDSLQFVARAMRAGHAFSVALEMVHSEFGKPLGGEFRRTFEEHNLGLPMETALQNLSERVPLIDVQFFVAAVLLQKRTGGNLAEILEKLASLIRDRFKLRGQIRTISAHGRLSSMVLTAIPLVVAVLMWMVYPEHMEFFVKNETGQWMAGLAVGLQALGYLVMRQIVKIEI